MPNENEITATDTTWNEEWFNSPDTSGAIAALDSLSSDSASVNPVSAALDTLEDDSGATFLPSSYYRSFGMNPPDIPVEEPKEEEEGFLPDMEVSQETMDKLSPAIAIGAGEILSKAKGFRFPEGWKPRLRAGGAKGVTYLLARDAYDIGSKFADEVLNIDTEGQAIAGATAAIGTWKAIPAMTRTILSDVKIGMAGQVVDDIAEETASGAARKIIERGTAMKSGKDKILAVASQASEKAKKEIGDQLAGEMHQRVGKNISKQWDDVARRLVNPNVAKKVGMYLATHAPNVARKLAFSSAATVFPEGISTAVGIGGLMITAWDILNLAQQMPALHALIFQEKSEEDVVMDSLSADENILTEDPMERYNTLNQIQID